MDCPKKWGFLWRQHCDHYRKEKKTVYGRCKLTSEEVTYGYSYCCLCKRKTASLRERDWWSETDAW